MTVAEGTADELPARVRPASCTSPSASRTPPAHATSTTASNVTTSCASGSSSPSRRTTARRPAQRPARRPRRRRLDRRLARRHHRPRLPRRRLRTPARLDHPRPVRHPRPHHPRPRRHPRRRTPRRSLRTRRTAPHRRPRPRTRRLRPAATRRPPPPRRDRPSRAHPGCRTPPCVAARGLWVGRMHGRNAQQFPRHPLRRPRQTREQIIAMLTKAYWMEMETVINYVTDSINPDGIRAQEIIESLARTSRRSRARAAVREAHQGAVRRRAVLSGVHARAD